MMLHVFSVFDHAVSAFLPPFYARSKGEAVRSFSEACNTEDHQFTRHAADFTLFELGLFDDSCGAFQQLSAPTRVISALECAVAEIPALKRTEARERAVM